jgi:hypothetical protein
MATVKTQLTPMAFIPATSNGASIKVAPGTNFPVPSLAFDASTAETVYAVFRASSYGSGNITCTLNWYADTASSGGVVWGASIAVITPDSDTQDIETKAFATENTVADTHLGTTGQRLHTCAITISNLDSVAGDDYVALKLRRLTADASDDMTGDALLTMVELSYSDA